LEKLNNERETHAQRRNEDWQGVEKELKDYQKQAIQTDQQNQLLHSQKLLEKRKSLALQANFNLDSQKQKDVLKQMERDKERKRYSMSRNTVIKSSEADLSIGGLNTGTTNKAQVNGKLMRNRH